MIRKDGQAASTMWEPGQITTRDRSEQLRDAGSLQVRQVGGRLQVATDVAMEGVPTAVNEIATSIIRTFKPDAEPVYGDALFTRSVGTESETLDPAEATLLLDAVSELGSLQTDGRTPTPTAETRTRLLQAFDVFKAVPDDNFEEAEQEPAGKADAKVPWTIAGVLALLTGVFGAILIIQSLGSTSTAPEEEEAPSVTETQTEEAPAENEEQPYDPSQEIEYFDKDKELNQRSDELDQRASELDQREQDISDREAAADGRSTQLDEREVAIAEQEDSLREHQNRLDQAIAQFNEMQREAEKDKEENNSDSDSEEDEDGGVGIPMFGTELNLP